MNTSYMSVLNNKYGGHGMGRVERLLNLCHKRGLISEGFPRSYGKVAF